PIVDIAQTTVAIRGDDAALHGLSRGEAARTVGLALWGEQVGQIFEEGVATPVVVRFEDAPREDPAQLSDALIPAPGGAAVPVSVLADIRTEPAPNYILREGVRRRVLVTANVAGTDPGRAAEAMRARLERLTLADGVTAELTGQSEQQRAAQRRLLL